MAYRVFFFTGEHTIVDGDTEKEVIENVWHFTSAQIEHMEPLGDNSTKGRSYEEEPEVREG